MKYSLQERMLAHDRAVPRYTSYPTAPHFQPLEDPLLYGHWLSALPGDASLSLYIHVPFCSKMCWYCGCHTKITRQYAPIENYVGLLIQEIKTLSSNLPAKVRVKNIHFGGGSPGLLTAHDFEWLMASLRENLDVDPSAEVAIEIDPRDIGEPRVAMYSKCGVSRVSLGVQDFNEDVLRAINRQQPFHLSYNAVRLLWSYGIRNINVDLLYGLPHQKNSTMRDTIQKLLLLDPDRVALFGYAHVPWMKKHMRLIDETTLPGKAQRLGLFETAADELQNAGYHAVGIDHFAKENDPLVAAARRGTLKRNFQGYTADRAHALIGLGASAIGHLPQGYVQNAIDLPSYKSSVVSEALPAKKYYPLTQEDHLRAAVIERLMCDFKADIPSISRAHGYDENFLDQELLSLDLFAGEGFIHQSRGVVTINPEARPMARLVSSVFDSYLPQNSSGPRHARAI